MSDKTDQRLRLTLRHLEVFAATARAGSTRAAADRVARSQSAASAALADLEAVLQTQLFDRVGRRLVLNEHGRALLPHAVALLDQAGELERRFVADHAAPLRLASSFTIGEYLLPALVAQWKQGHPRSPVKLAIANTHDVLRAVAAFEADIGFVEGTGSHPELSVRHWLDDELVVVCAPGHALARRRNVSATDLAAAPWVLREMGSGTREAADRWLTRELGQFTVALELGSNEAVKHAVAAGLGLGCLSRHAVAEALQLKRLAAPAHRLPPIRRALAVVVHRSRRLGTVAADFVGHCLAHRPALPVARRRAAGGE